MKAPLEQLGLRKPFVASQTTDLTKIAARGGQPARNMYVSDILHKVYIKVRLEL